MSATHPKEARANVLKKVGAADGSGFTVRLYKSISPALSDDTQLSHIVEADYNGYAAMTSSSWAITTLSGGDEQFLSSVFVFTHNSTVDSGSVIGAYVTFDDGGTKLFQIEPFSASVSMTGPASTCPVQIAIALRDLAS